MPARPRLWNAGAWRHLPFLLLFLAGCAGAPEAARPPAYAVSHDGVLRYRMPDGWFDATSDPQAGGHAVWLLSNDYTMSITVDEVRLDRHARADIGDDDLLRLSELVMSLVAADHSAQVTELPGLREFNGNGYCTFGLETETGEKLRVAVLDTGEHAYTVTFFRTAEGGASELLPVEEAFLGALDW